MMAESLTAKPSGFQPYEKMTLSTNLWQSQKLDSIKKWVAMEKIHGANFSFTVVCRHVETAVKGSVAAKMINEHVDTVLMARRGDYLKEGENFFGVTKQREFLEREKEKAKSVSTMVKRKMDGGTEPIESVTIFGELFGGYYPHPSVARCPGVSNVQKEVVYCPDLKFCAYDIAISTLINQQQDRRYLNYDTCMDLFRESGFFYAEPLATGTLQDMISYPLGFESTLPRRFGLPALDKPNVAEGIVIKPVKNTILDTKKGPKRVIFKRKVEGFAEVKPKGRADQGYKKQAATSGSWTPDNAQADFELIRYEMLALITTQRVVNVISKLGLPAPASTSLMKEKQPKSRDTPTEPQAIVANKKQDGEEVASQSGGWVEWKDIVRGLMKDVTEELESDHGELWSSCQRDKTKTGDLMQELREECTQVVKDYKKSL